MQNNHAIRERKRPRGGLGAACVLLITATLTSCEQQSSSPSSPATTQVVDDSRAAYAALSSALERCEQSYDSCLATAGTNADARARCEQDAVGCREQAEPMAQQAQDTLEREAHHCHKLCSDDDAGPGGTDAADGGSGDLDECIDKHAPRLPRCLGGLAGCLAHVGPFQRDATLRGLGSCVREAHACIKDRLAELRRHKHGHDARDASVTDSGAGSDAALDSGATAGDDAAVDASSAPEPSPAREDRRRGRRHDRWKPFWKR